MELEERVADLERRLAALETAGAAETARRGAPRLGEGDFWALEGLKNQLAELRAADGGVLFTGAVRLPTGEQYEWQHGALTGGLLEDDWPAAAEPLAALGHPVRLRLLREILGGRRTAAELAELDGVGTTGQIYHHLRQLTGAGWLHTTGRGRHEVPAGRVVPLLVLLSAARP
ncbi:winged helix-turn-helix domain-containing protein [Streptomyces hirsutus]|uniref:Winged helix-turn-helix domain-containing protein n=1 Tax=Streptomyces hirsutus TaxID=35620 RepID=A0ABZ1GQ33_9ACTN|nr:winged helix-turn-helix domain-containing protein [Streptomyces hirsutus]WSD07548.1 winged helix-turn-helix domain-containing protein [Streptomyces hirsutus]WTD19037.1 winged helix-turn-helix domain-containing protein [Streptomyces hirsutus]WTD76046.1 winged helix-turn-helix domain-containing protein [Streptomyces sp. NBC_01635]